MPLLNILVYLIVFELTCPNSALSLHPLAPLTTSELKNAAATLRDHGLLGNGYYIQLLYLDEPGKEQILGPGHKTPPRMARAVVVNAADQKNYEVAIDLAKGTLSKTRIKTGQPAIMSIEYDSTLKIVRTDPRVIEALKTRGIEDIDKVYIDTWGVGEFKHAKLVAQHRLVRTIFFYRDKAINPYGRPISGLSTIVDLTKKQVLEVIDTGIFAIPESAEDFFDEAWIEKVSGGVVHNQVNSQTPSKKTSFSIDGNKIHWEGFRFSAFFHPREGLVISEIGIEDHGQVRPILYRGSLSEMVVPYGDPDKDWAWRCAFDEGDYGLGTFTNSLKRGSQIPANAHTMDAVYAGNEGDIKTIKNAIAVYERGPTLLWSHYDDEANKIAAQLGKELVVMSMFTISNYDYAIQWIFNQSGEIKVNVLLTGIVSVKALNLASCARCEAMSQGQKQAQPDRFGTIVAPNLLAVIHQHFFNFRLDFSIDGVNNSVVEVNYVPLKDKKENPAGNAFTYTEEVLSTEKKAARNAKPSEGRHWWIINPERRNNLGHFSGYMLEPPGTARPYEQNNSQALNRAPFLANQLWVTKYNQKEMHAAGDYPNQNQGGGLPEWTKRNASIANEDIVVWYTIGVNHIPRVEDWPVMPTLEAGLTLRPKGFFTRNPSLNVVSKTR